MKIIKHHIELTIAANVILMAAAALWFLPKPATVRYDCSIAEISPDFPIKAREECRQLRANKS